MRITVILSLLVSISAFAQNQIPIDTIKRPSVSAINDTLGVARINESTLADQSEVAITIYNNNLALVKDTRKLPLLPGEIKLQFMDVAKLIKPETVSMRSISNPGSLRILEQNYEFDLISYEKLMEKYVGNNVKLVNFSNQLGFHEKDAKLMSYTQGRPIYEIDGEIFLNHPGSVVLPEIPGNLIAKPTLVWLLDNNQTDQNIEVTYLTNGVSWRADYVVVYDDKEHTMNLDAWITLNNQSGAAYTDATLKLVAGDVNVVSGNMQPKAMRGRAFALEAADASGVRQESFAEYHLYTVPRKTTIKENQSKQINLFSAQDITVNRVYEFRGQPHFYSQRIPHFDSQKVASYLVFENEQENQLGIPLPGGVLRVYQRDNAGALQFSGEDRINHTPKDETIRLKLGNAFDVVGERKQMDFRKITGNVYESTYEITLRNHKEEDITVDVVEPIYGTWTILDSNHSYKKVDSQSATFSLPVKKDGETILTYRVRIEH